MRNLVLVAAVGTGAVGGVFYAFSSFVMPGLGRLPASQGLAAMQSINITAVRPAFMLGLFGTAAVCLPLVISGVRSWGDRRATLLVVGGALYLVGAIALTAAYHVPLNDKLAKLDPHSATAAAQWKDYLRNWTLLNHVRAVASLGAAAAFTAAFRA
jgi:uncharacterized membrane protein